MKPRDVQSFEWAKHPSGMPYMRSICCASRINHQKQVESLPKPQVYGIQLPPAEQVVITHVADYACKCGKTVLRVEGMMETLLVTGCIAVKKEPA